MVSMHISGGSAHEGSRGRESQAISVVLVMGLAGLIGLSAVGRSRAQSRSERSSPKPASSPRSTPAPKIRNDVEARQVAEMERAIVELRKKGRFAEAIAPAQEVLAIRTRAQGADHWGTADARRQAESLAKIAAMASEARATFASAERIAAEGDDLFERGEHLKARPLRQEASDRFRRIFGEDHEKTARSEDKLGYNLYRLGLWAEAEPLLRKARTTLLRVLGEAHPDMARISHELGYCLDALKKHDEAESLFQQACQIWRRSRGEDHPDTASGYDGLANHLKELGKHAEAEPLFRKALEIDRRALGEDDPQTACAYFNLAHNLFVRRDFAEAEKLHQKALEIRLKVLPQDHPDTALSYSGLAWTLAASGRLSEVEHLLSKALEIRRRVLGEDHRETAESYQGLARTLHGLGRTDEAVPLFRKAMEIRREVLGEDDPNTADSSNSLVEVLQQCGRFAELEPLRHKLLESQLKVLGGDHPTIASSYQILANELYVQGKYAEAELVYHKALDIRRRTLGEGHHLTAEIYNDLAANLWSQGKTAEAEPLFQKALEIRRRALGEDHPGTANSYQNLAANLSAQGKHAEAQSHYRKALAIPRGQGKDHPEMAATYDSMAHDLYAQGEYAEAEPLFQEALSIWRRTSGEDHPDAAYAYSNLAVNLDAQGKYTEAEVVYQKAMAIYRRTLGEDHPDTAFSYSNLAANLHARGKYVEAEAMAIAAAQRYEVARSRVSFTGLDRVEFASKRSPLPLVAALLARRGCDRDAWQRWEAGLARGLFDDLAARRGRPLATEERIEQEELCGKLNGLDNQIGALASVKALTDDQRRLLDKLEFQRLELQGRLARFESGLVRKYQVAAGAVFALDKIQARLAPDAALVGWLDLRTMPNPADPQADHWACVVRHSGAPRWVRIRGTGPGRSWTRTDDHRPDAVRQLLSGQSERDWQKPLAELAEQRLAPLETVLGADDALPAVRHLIVLPSPALAGIPVETLLVGRPRGAPQYLVSYVPSGTLFAWLRERDHEDQGKPSRPRRLLALGDPIPRPADDPISPTPESPDQGAVLGARPAADAIRARRATDALIRATRGAAFIPLPGSRREVQDIAALFDQGTALLGSDASEQSLATLRDRGELGTFTVIHLATHGEMDDLCPMNSRLLLSQDRMSSPRSASPSDGPVFDGTLSASEVMSTWKLNAELVTLSACRSGLGRQGGGEGYLGFSQALFLAGTRSVVLSLWNVDDAATSLLMKRFYQDLLGRRPGLDHPLPKAEALAEAKEWVRSLSFAEADRLCASLPAVPRIGKVSGPPRSAAKTGRPYEHPYYWAAFILIGDPS